MLHPQGALDLPAQVEQLVEQSCGKHPPGLASAPAVPLEPWQRVKNPKRTQQPPTKPSSSCRNKPMVVMGVSSALIFGGQLLRDELEHQERKTAEVFSRGNCSGSCFQLHPGCCAQSQAQTKLKLLNNRRAELRFQVSCQVRERSTWCFQHCFKTWGWDFHHGRVWGWFLGSVEGEPSVFCGTDLLLCPCCGDLRWVAKNLLFPSLRAMSCL